jgi:lysophospholipase L1-like esterase
MSLVVVLICWATCGFADEAPTIDATTRASFPTRVLGSIAAIGDSITQAYDAKYSDFEACRFIDNPEYSFSTNTTSNTTTSVAERAIVYKGGGMATANFGSDGAKMSAGVDQAQAAKTWALAQATPRLITIFLGHNDICGGEKDKHRTSCNKTSQCGNGAGQCKE